MIHHTIAQTAATPVRVVDRLEGLSAIRDPGCAAAIWRRPRAPRFQTWLDGLAPEQLPTGRMVLHPKAVRAVALQICDAAGLPDCAERTALVDDIALLAETFAGLMGAPWVRVHFDLSASAATGTSPGEALTARLVCTYRGPVTRYCLARGAAPPCVIAVPNAAPAILTGSSWDGRAPQCHRAPTAEDGDMARFVFALDPVLDLEETL